MNASASVDLDLPVFVKTECEPRGRGLCAIHVSGDSVPTPKMVGRQVGFTLVEVAIVLVVIGLIVGGVTAGQQLIRSAKTNQALSTLDSIAAAVLAFNDRYERMPGDYHAASVHMNCAITCLNGNGNRRVERNAIPVSGSEVHEELLVWSHLSGAGFINGEEVFRPVAGGTVPTLANTPRNGFGVTFKFVYDGNFGTAPDGTARHNFKTGNRIPVDLIQEIDTKIDDELPTLAASGSRLLRRATWRRLAVA